MDSVGASELLAGLQAFFATPAPVAGLALARLALGVLLFVDTIPYFLDRRAWLLRGGATGPANGLWWRSASAANLFLLVHAFGSLGLVAGSSSLLVRLLPFFSLTVLHRRTPMIAYGGDSLLRIGVLLLGFSPAHEAVSLERYLAHGDLGLGVVAPPWGGRLLQVELSLLYLYNCLHKLEYRAWRDGSAVWFCLRNSEVARSSLGSRLVPAAWIISTPFSRLATWSTLLIEGGLGVGLWITEARVPLLIVAVGFHVLLACLLEIWLFSHIVIACLLVFLPSDAFGQFGRSEVSFGPEGGVGVALATMAAVAYAVTAALSNPPVSSDVLDRVKDWLERNLSRIGLSRGLKLFTGDPPAARTYTVRILVTEAGGSTRRLCWSPRDGLHQSETVKHRWGVRHRVHKLSAALAKGPDTDAPEGPEATAYADLVAAFGRYLLEECRAANIVPKVMSVDCEVVCLPDPRPHAPKRTDFSRNIFTYIAPTSTDDERAAMALALTSASTSSASIELLVYLGVRARASGRDDREILAALRGRLAKSVLPPERAEAICRWAREFAPRDCNAYFELLSEERSGDGVDAVGG